MTYPRTICGYWQIKTNKMRTKEEIMGEWLPCGEYTLADGLGIETAFQYYNKNKISRMLDEHAKEVAIAFANYRDDFKREENRKFHAEAKRLGGMLAFLGASDEKIFEKFIQSIKP